MSNKKALQDDKPENKQGFIPGLPNDIVLQHIATKLPWSVMYPLTRVNQEWRRAIRSREVYDVRKQCGAAQAMITLPVQSRDMSHKGFYDMDTGDTYLFPMQEAMPEAENCSPVLQHMASTISQLQDFTPDDPYHEFIFSRSIVFLDGSLYAIQESNIQPASGSVALQGTKRNIMDEVQVLDIGACAWEWKCCSQWKRCPSSIIHDCTDLWVACDERIYSFHFCKNRLHGKVFDSKNATCKEIKDRPISALHLMPYRPSEYRISAILNKEIYWANRKALGEDIMVFDTAAETWRTIPNTMNKDIQEGIHVRAEFCFAMIVVEEKLYSFSDSYIQRYNPESNSWTALDRSFDADFNHLKDEAGDSPHLLAVTRYGKNEVIALLVIKRSAEGGHFQEKIFKSVSFGVDGKNLIWEEFPHDFSVDDVVFDVSGFLLDYLEL